MVTHSSVLAWRIPGMGEPGGFPSMGSHRIGHDRSDLAAAAAAAKGFQASSLKSLHHGFNVEYFFFVFNLLVAACRILVPPPGNAPPVLEAWSLSHRTAREVPNVKYL